MVKRYDGTGHVEYAEGHWVMYGDYAALQAALKEALTNWEYFEVEYRNWRGEKPQASPRIPELRKQFLE